jgi:hypothetical protein
MYLFMQRALPFVVEQSVDVDTSKPWLAGRRVELCRTEGGTLQRRGFGRTLMGSRKTPQHSLYPEPDRRFRRYRDS